MTMLERVARAIRPLPWDENIRRPPGVAELEKELAFAEARAAIEAMQEPTEKMWGDGFEAVGYDSDLIAAWNAMISAALSEIEDPSS